MKVKILKSLINLMDEDGDVFFEINESIMEKWAKAVLIDKDMMWEMLEQSIESDTLEDTGCNTLIIRFAPRERKLALDRAHAYDEQHREEKIIDNA